MTFDESIAKIDSTLQRYLAEIDRSHAELRKLRASNAELLAAAKEALELVETPGGVTVQKSIDTWNALRVAISKAEALT